LLNSKEGKEIRRAKITDQVNLLLKKPIRTAERILTALRWLN
jgi:hypothetical protein